MYRKGREKKKKKKKKENQITALTRRLNRQEIRFDLPCQSGCVYRPRPLTFPPTPHPPPSPNLPRSPNTNCGTATALGHKCIRSDSYILSHLTTSWHHLYNADPTDGIDDVAQAGLVIGGEAVLWSHTVDSSVFHSTVFPRAAAMGGSVLTLMETLSWHGYHYWF